MAAHSRFPASSAYRWTKCPASVRMADDIPVERPGPEASRGSAIHFMAAKNWTGDDAPQPGQYWVRRGDHEGVWTTACGGDQEVTETCEITEDMIAEAKCFSDFCAALRAKYPAGKTYCETRMKLTDAIGGSVDFALTTPDVIIVVDLKTGMQPVSAENNAQLMLYAAMVADDQPDETRVVLAIHQGGKVDVWDTTLATMRDFAADAIDASRHADSPPKPGDHCLYCRASGVCAAYAETRLALLPDDSEAAGPLAPERMTPEQIARVLDAEKALTDWIKRVKAHVMATRVAVPGWKFVAGVSRRQVARPGVIAEYAEEHGLDVWRAPELRTLAELDKICPADIMTAACDKPDPGVALAPEKDKRPAINASAVAALDALD